MNLPDGMRPEGRTLVEARSPEEWRNVVADVRRMGAAGKLPYAAGDLADDVRKAAVALGKHVRDLGIEATSEALTARSNAIVGNAEQVFARVYHGEVQLSFGSSEHRAYAVVDLGLQLCGAYGHRKQGGWKKCLQENLNRNYARLK